MNTHDRHVEKLCHFKCFLCSRWWSIGDAPERPFWFCPWCGTKDSNPEVKTIFDPDSVTGDKRGGEARWNTRTKAQTLDFINKYNLDKTIMYLPWLHIGSENRTLWLLECGLL